MIFNILSILLKLMEGHRIFTESKKKGILFYLKLLQILRTSIVGAIFVVFALQLFVFCVVGVFLTGLYLIPIEFETKVWIVLSVCTAVVLFVGVLLTHIFSEKTWYKHSGAEHLIPK